jgi:hypothetical protein
VIRIPLLVLLMLLAATLVAALWYWFPAWVPRRWPRLRRPHWRLRWPAWRWGAFRLRWRWPGWGWPAFGWLRWRRRKPPETPADEEPVVEASAEEMPEMASAEFASLADRLAAEGRYAEAVRERLRGMVRELIERGVLEHRPGWTVTELAAAAARRRPAVAGPLDAAALIFSDIWYGQRPAGAAEDARMRDLALSLTTALTAAAREPVGVSS